MRIAVLGGCASPSSVAVVSSKKSKSETRSDEGRSSSSNDQGKMKTRNASGFSDVPKPKPNKVTRGIRRLIRSIKNISQAFVYKEETDDEETETTEMEIGYPTDVKHLTHIGLDGATTTNNPIKGWENLKAPEIISFPSVSLKELEIAMAAQAHGATSHIYG